MELTESNYMLTLTRDEMLALQKALNELETLQQKHPDERNGYDPMSQTRVSNMRAIINASLA